MSGDTAIPLPELIDRDAVAEGQTLRPAQLRRVEALQVARRMLESKGGMFGGSKVEENRAVYDLTYLADWIIDGPSDFDGDEDYPDATDVANAQRQGFADGVKASATFLAAGGSDLNELLANGEGFPDPTPGDWEPGPPSFDHDDATPPENDPR
jgi:hypothetical protein